MTSMDCANDPITTTLWTIALRAVRHEDAYFAFQRTGSRYSPEQWQHFAAQFRASERYAASSAALRFASEFAGEEKAKLLLDAGNDALRSGDAKVASQLARLALDTSQAPKVIVDAAVLLCSAADFERAAPALRQAAQLEPRNAGVWSRLSAIEGVHGSSATAVEYARAALEARPSDRALMLELADTLLSQHDRTRAPELLSEAASWIDRAAASKGPRSSLALRQARLASRRGESDRAVQIAVDAMRGNKKASYKLAMLVVHERIEQRSSWRSLKDALNRWVGCAYRAMHERKFADAYFHLMEVAWALRSAKHVRGSLRRAYERRLQRAWRRVRAAEGRDL
ncbi:MAG: hypothetical protein JNK05_20545 [Myxococcales bacterium]|nr:hypothetical protein [Myxococcales bacterium]